ncbi:MAG TPA: GDP-mannose 4,6-dehydratase, partial [Pyrinomonadaceae bacterium]|nr:GDP-mannose 4,6-dehydratase [Pyrinomonadaceae bacterium]
FSKAGLDYREYVKIDEKFYRPAEVDLLIGDASKARRALGWEPRYTFEELVDEMCEADIASHRAASPEADAKLTGIAG